MLATWTASSSLFIAAQAVLLAIADRRGHRPGRTIDDIRELDRPRATGDDLGGRVRRLIEEADAATFELDGVRRDLSYLIELIGIGIVRLDDDRRIELANAAAHRSSTARLARSWPAVTGSLPRRPDRGAIVETAREPVPLSARSACGPDGAVLVVRARRSPVRGVWAVLEDVSELRRLQQIRAEFIDNLSHELRTPLTTVSLLGETLAREADAAGDAVPAKMRDRIAKIEVETGHLVQMVNELLDLARIESGGPLVLLDDVDLGRVARESVDAFGCSPSARADASFGRSGRVPRSVATRTGSARSRQPRPQRAQVRRRSAAT